jgi:hypothetical protein
MIRVKLHENRPPYAAKMEGGVNQEWIIYPRGG